MKTVTMKRMLMAPFVLGLSILVVNQSFGAGKDIYRVTRFTRINEARLQNALATKHRDKDGNTALHEIVLTNHNSKAFRTRAEQCQSLIDELNHKGQTPYDLGILIGLDPALLQIIKPTKLAAEEAQKSQKNYENLLKELEEDSTRQISNQNYGAGPISPRLQRAGAGAGAHQPSVVRKRGRVKPANGKKSARDNELPLGSPRNSLSLEDAQAFEQALQAKKVIEWKEAEARERQEKALKAQQRIAQQKQAQENAAKKEAERVAAAEAARQAKQKAEREQLIRTQEFEADQMDPTSFSPIKNGLKNLKDFAKQRQAQEAMDQAEAKKKKKEQRQREEQRRMRLREQMMADNKRFMGQEVELIRANNDDARDRDNLAECFVAAYDVAMKALGEEVA